MQFESTYQSPLSINHIAKFLGIHETPKITFIKSLSSIQSRTSSIRFKNKDIFKVYNPYQYKMQRIEFLNHHGMCFQYISFRKILVYLHYKYEPCITIVRTP